MTVLKVGEYAKISASEDIRNIGKVVNLYAYYEKYTAPNGITYYNTWLFDCNEGFMLTVT